MADASYCACFVSKYFTAYKYILYVYYFILFLTRDLYGVLRESQSGCFHHRFAFRLLEANMAAEGDVDLDLEAEENCTGKPTEKPRKHDSGAADLERVTDYAEEKEISSSNLETVS